MKPDRRRDEYGVKLRSMDRERKRLVEDRQERMKGPSQSWTQHVNNAIAKKLGRKSK